MVLPGFPVRMLQLLLLSALLLGASSPPPAEECSPMSIRKCPPRLPSTPDPFPDQEGLRSFPVNTRGNRFVLGDKQTQEIQAPTTVLLVPCLYLLAFVIGLPANLVALWVLLLRTKKLPSTALLINLTSTDLMLLAFLPFRIYYHFNHNHWVFGEPLCRLVTALFYGNMYGSVLSLTLVSVDRYVALVHPFGARTLRGWRVSLGMTAAVWAVVVAAMAPLLASQQSYTLDVPPITTCHDALPKEEQERFFGPYFTVLFVACFLLPLLVVLFCYGAVLHTLLARGRRYAHAVRVTTLVLLVFIVCFLPSNILLLLHYTDSYQIDNSDSYQFDYSGSYLINYSGSYLLNYSGSYLSNYSGSYLINSSGSYLNDYSGSYLNDYSGSYLSNYSGSYLINSSGSYLNDYSGSYLNDYSGSYLKNDKQDLYVPYMISLAISSFNSCLDPFIFYFVSEDFRDKVWEALCCCRGVADKESSSTNQISSSTSGQSGKSQSTLLCKFNATTEQDTK